MFAEAAAVMNQVQRVLREVGSAHWGSRWTKAKAAYVLLGLVDVREPASANAVMQERQNCWCLPSDVVNEALEIARSRCHTDFATMIRAFRGASTQASDARVRRRLQEHRQCQEASVLVAMVVQTF